MFPLIVKSPYKFQMFANPSRLIIWVFYSPAVALFPLELFVHYEYKWMHKDVILFLNVCIAVLWLKLNYYSWIRAVRIRKCKGTEWKLLYFFSVNIHAKIIMEPFDDLMALGLDDWMKFVIYCQIDCFFLFCSVLHFVLHFFWQNEISILQLWNWLNLCT